jgi:putative transcriptional regulator
MNNDILLQNRIKEARQEKKLSQEDLAKLVGTTRQTIISIEKNQFNPSARLALLICIALEKKFEEKKDINLYILYSLYEI